MKNLKRLTPVAVAVSLLAVGQAPLAGEPIQFGDGYVFDWRVNTTYTLSTRLNDRDPLLAGSSGSSGSNDGNRNFDKGSLTGNRLGALLETKLSKGASGLVVSASAFYDDVYHKANDSNPGTGLPNAGFNPDGISKPAPFNEFTDQARRYHGGYARFLDVYGYTAFDLGATHATVRLGRHVVSWGEALFFPERKPRTSFCPRTNCRCLWRFRRAGPCSVTHSSTSIPRWHPRRGPS